MQWKKWYMDAMLVPLGLLICAGYHAFQWRKVSTQPFSTVVASNAAARSFWVTSIIKDNEKKNILAVQTLRNTIMGSTLMATTAILLCCGLAAVLSSTYAIKKPLNDAFYGTRGEFTVLIKYMTLLLLLLLASFFCHLLSIRFINQVNFLINCGPDASSHVGSAEYVSTLLERGFTANMMGNRLFYAALPMLLWIFGTVPVFLCFV